MKLNKNELTALLINKYTFVCESWISNINVKTLEHLERDTLVHNKLLIMLIKKLKE